jgi:hypothetical protein
MDTALAVTYGSLPAVTSAPDNTQAMVCNYPAGGIGGKSGFSFYSAGNVEGVDVSTAKEVVISYSIWFDSDFEWVKGGKLPGLYGGATADTAKGCSGGSKRDDCFSTRLMWRTDGMGEFYDYVPVSATQAYCSASDSHCNPAYGDSIGRGAWNFTRGAWNTVTMRVKLNDAGSDNGEQQMWLNGKSVLNVSNITFRLSNDVKFQGIMAQTFFGGSTSDYAPSVEQHAWFKDWTLAIIA